MQVYPKSGSVSYSHVYPVITASEIKIEEGSSSFEVKMKLQELGI